MPLSVDEVGIGIRNGIGITAGTGTAAGIFMWIIIGIGIGKGLGLLFPKRVVFVFVTLLYSHGRVCFVSAHACMRLCVRVCASGCCTGWAHHTVLT